MTVVPCTDPSAEAAYVAAVMLRPEAYLEHPVALEEITTRTTRTTLAAMVAIVQRREELSTHALVRELERIGVPPSSAIEYAIDATKCDLASPAPTARRLRELGELRRRREQALRIVAACEAHAIDDARGASAALGAQLAAQDVETMPFADVARDTLQAFVDNAEETGRSMRLGTPSVDGLWRPYPGSLTVVGAATGTGKSTLLTSWALSLAQRDIPCGVVSAEDPAEDFGSKWLGELAHVDPGWLWRGRIDAERMGRIVSAAEKHRSLPISFAHVISRRLDDVLAAMRLCVRRHRARVVMIDYLQTIIPRGAWRDARAAIDSVLADLIVEAGALGVALVLASQLRRSDRDDGAEPSATWLKESGTIENRAQAIVLMWKSDTADVVHAKIAKVKRAPSGRKFDLWRNPETGQLVERTTEDEF